MKADDEVWDSGVCGDGLTWKLTKDKELIISGRGEMYSYSPQEAPWYKDLAQISKVRIESGVTSIGASAFYECGQIESVEIPKSVTAIGEAAFSFCEKLESISLPESVTSIPDAAFSGSGLTAIELPKSIRSISEQAFSNCTKLTSVSMTGVEKIGKEAFLGCSALTSVKIPEKVTAIEAGTFYECTALQDVTIPAGVTSIEENAFDTCSSLEKVFYGASEVSWKQIKIETGNDALKEAEIVYTWALFKDVPETSAFANAIYWARDMGITSGINKDGTIFGINDACTRGQIVTFLWRAAGSPEPNTDQNVFTDVKETSPFYKAILWATERGITSGMTDTLFGIDMSCTRGRAVTFIHRYAHTPEYMNGAVFKDVPEKMFCYKAVSWAVEQGITKGTDKAGTLFSPDAFCTRGQIVTFLYRYQN